MSKLILLGHGQSLWNATNKFTDCVAKSFKLKKTGLQKVQTKQ